jgi:hypothetical protein
VRDAVTAEPVADLAMKGKADPVPAHRLIEVTPGAAGFARHLDAPIVGRERELSLLRDVFDRTLTDQACQLFTVLGVGGVGKSRLLAAFVDGIADQATILRGRCLPYGEGITFYPLAEALIDVADLRENDTPEAARRKLTVLAGDDGDAVAIVERVGQAIGLHGGETTPEEMRWAVRALLERLPGVLLDATAFKLHELEDVAEITELDLNPVMAFAPGKGCGIVDARIRVAMPQRHIVPSRREEDLRVFAGWGWPFRAHWSW